MSEKNILINLWKDLAERVREILTGFGLRVIDDKVEEEQLSEVRYLLVDPREVNPDEINGTYQIVENKITIISPTPVGDLDKFFEVNGRIILNFNLLQAQLGQKLVERIFTRLIPLPLEERFEELKNIKMIKISSPEQIGHYTDMVASISQENSFNYLAIRNFMMNVTYFFMYLEKSEIIGFPIEVEFGSTEDEFVLQLYTDAKEFVFEYIKKSFQVENSFDPLLYLLGNSYKQCQTMDVSYFNRSSKIVISGHWLKVDKSTDNYFQSLFLNKLDSIPQNSVPINVSDDKEIQLVDDMKNLEGGALPGSTVEEQQREVHSDGSNKEKSSDGEISEEMHQKIVDDIHNELDTSIFNESSILESIKKTAKDLVDEEEIKIASGDEDETEDLEKIKGHLDEMKNETKDFTKEQIQEDIKIVSGDFDLFGDDEDVIKGMRDSFNDLQEKITSGEELDPELIKKIKGMIEDKEESIKVSGTPEDQEKYQMLQNSVDRIENNAYFLSSGGEDPDLLKKKFNTIKGSFFKLEDNFLNNNQQDELQDIISSLKSKIDNIKNIDEEKENEASLVKEILGAHGELLDFHRQHESEDLDREIMPVSESVKELKKLAERNLINKFENKINKIESENSFPLSSEVKFEIEELMIDMEGILPAEKFEKIKESWLDLNFKDKEQMEKINKILLDAKKIKSEINEFAQDLPVDADNSSSAEIIDTLNKIIEKINAVENEENELDIPEKYKSSVGLFRHVKDIQNKVSLLYATRGNGESEHHRAIDEIIVNEISQNKNFLTDENSIENLSTKVSENSGVDKSEVKEVIKTVINKIQEDQRKEENVAPESVKQDLGDQSDEIQKLEGALNKAHHEIESLKSLNDKLRDAINNPKMTEKGKTKYEEEKENLSNELNQTKEIIQKGVEAVVHAKDEHKISDAEYLDLKRAVDEVKNITTRYEKLHSEFIEHKKEKEAMITSLNSQLQASERKYKAYEMGVDRLKSSFEANKEQHKKQLDWLKKREQELLEENKKLKKNGNGGSNNGLIEENRVLAKRVELVENKNKQLTSQLKVVATRGSKVHDSDHEKLHNLQVEKDKLQHTLKTTQNAQGQSEKRIKNLETQLKQSTKMNMQLKETKKKLFEAEALAKRHADEVKIFKQNFHVEIEKVKKKEVAETEQKLRKAEKQLQTVLTQNQELATKLKSTMQHEKEKSSGGPRGGAQAAGGVDPKTKLKISHLEKNVMNLGHEVESYKKQMEVYKKQINDSKLNMSKSKKENEVLKSQLSALRKQLEKMKKAA